MTKRSRLGWKTITSKPQKLMCARLFRAYQNPRLTLIDYAYLLSMHPLDLWCATEFCKDADLPWEKLWSSSSGSASPGLRLVAQHRNHRAQNVRLRIRIERDAFTRMTPYWQRLGFPFKTMVPTYATAIGSSSDRPVALAELVGILVNDGVRRPATSLTKIHFASRHALRNFARKNRGIKASRCSPRKSPAPCAKRWPKWSSRAPRAGLTACSNSPTARTSLSAARPAPATIALRP